jgi:hypothetical protein
MSTQFAPQGVPLWLVYPNPDDTLAAVRAHPYAHVHVTPEAAIFHRDAMQQPVLWHGRIDDRYLSFGTQRPAATRHDLADALNALLEGRQPAPPAAPPIGCAILPSAILPSA